MYENFNAIYNVHVEDIIKLCNKWITHEGIEYPIIYNMSLSICVARSRYYNIHPHIQELLACNIIRKAHALSIELKLSTGPIACRYQPSFINGVPLFQGKCQRCTRDCDISEYRWIKPTYHSVMNTYVLQFLCESCYADRSEEKYVRVHVCDFRPLDWVQFASTDDDQFYTNCNTESPDYGKILHGYSVGAYVLVEIGNVADFMQLVCNWITYSPTDMQPYKFNVDNEKINDYLDSIMTGRFYEKGHPERPTRRYILENKDVKVSMSEQLIERVRENMKFRRSSLITVDGKNVRIVDLTHDEFENYITAEAQTKVGSNLYPEYIVNSIESNLIMYLQNIHPQSRSFSKWLYSLYLKN